MVKINKTKKLRGGHVFYFEDFIGEKCRTGFLGMHQNDCWPTTLYLLGMLTYEMAQTFAMDTKYVSEYNGVRSELIMQWLDDALGESHSYDVLFDSDGPARNRWFMAYLNFLLPYNYLGMPITYEIYGIDSDGNEYPIAGHAFCIIKNGGGDFRILDAQANLNLPLHHISDLLSVLPEKFSYVNDQCVTRAKIFGFMQSALYDEWHDRTDNRNHFNVSPFAEHWYNTANNSVRDKMHYEIDNQDNNEEGNYEEQEEYTGWYENGYNNVNNRTNGGWGHNNGDNNYQGDNFGQGDNNAGLNTGNYHAEEGGDNYGDDYGGENYREDYGEEYAGEDYAEDYGGNNEG